MATDRSKRFNKCFEGRSKPTLPWGKRTATKTLPKDTDFVRQSIIDHIRDAVCPHLESQGYRWTELKDENGLARVLSFWTKDDQITVQPDGMCSITVRTCPRYGKGRGDVFDISGPNTIEAVIERIKNPQWVNLPTR